jgi:hypothetical protein
LEAFGVIYTYESEERVKLPWDPDRLYTWPEARPFLNKEYDSGYGSPGCPEFTAWTENRVIFVDQYDGATSVQWVPRHPTPPPPDPIMPGGS